MDLTHETLTLDTVTAVTFAGGGCLVTFSNEDVELCPFDSALGLTTVPAPSPN